VLSGGILVVLELAAAGAIAAAWWPPPLPSRLETPSEPKRPSQSREVSVTASRPGGIVPSMDPQLRSR
jgi:hypothetical protein